MIKMILVALGLTAITVIIHGFGTAVAARWVACIWMQRKDRPGRLGAELVMARVVGSLLLLHLAEN